MPRFEIPTDEKGNFVFGSQREYEGAVETLSGSREKVDPAMLQRLLSQEGVVIKEQQAQPQESQPNVSRETLEGYNTPATPPEPDQQQSATKNKLIERLKEKAKAEGLEISYENEDELVDALLSKEKHNRYLQGERDKLMNTLPSTETPPAEPSHDAPAPTPQGDDFEGIGESKRARIDQLRQEMDRMDNPLSDEYVEKSREYNALVSYEMGRLEQIASKTKTGYGKLQQRFDEELDSLRNQVNSVREEFSTKQQNTSENEMITSFQKKHKDYSTSKNLDDLDKEFVKWARDLHAVRYGEQTSEPRKLRMVVDSYLKGDIDLKKLAANNGLDMPKEMDKYIAICDLLGYKARLDNAFNGKNHSLDDALIYKLNSEGKLEEAFSVQRQLGAEAMNSATQKRDTNFARVVNAAETAPEGQGMTPDQALKIIQMTNAAEAKKNPTVAAQLNEAYKIAGVPQFNP